MYPRLLNIVQFNRFIFKNNVAQLLFINDVNFQKKGVEQRLSEVFTNNRLIVDRNSLFCLLDPQENVSVEISKIPD